MQTPIRSSSVSGPAPRRCGAVLRRVVLLVLFCAAPLCVSPLRDAAHAQGFQPPGLDRDSAAYAASLAARAPAGGTPQTRRQAETRAADATRRGDWSGVAAALEARIAAGEATPDHWLSLARAQLRRVPPEAERAAQAAWQAFARSEAGAPEIPPLLVLAEAFRAMGRPDQAVGALEAVLERAPGDAGYRRMLADARRAAGLQVRRVRTEAETDPPRACVEFTTAPARRADVVPGDWVRTDPPQPGVAVTREGDQFCLTGLALGATTRVLLRAGLPGEDGLALQRDTVLPVAMGDRAPRLFFDARRFVLPRGQAPRITLAGVNVAAVRLRMLRLSERALVSWTRESRLGAELESYAVSTLEEAAKVVWEGRAEVPGYRLNRVVRTVLPLPDAFAEPGAYVLLVNQADGTGEDGAFAAQAILRTDLAPTVWRGSDGLTVQVRGFSDAQPRAGVRLGLIARNNDVLGEAVTDADGVARFAAPLLRGTGAQAPQAVHGTLPGAAGVEDFVALDLNAAAFDLSDRGVEGQPQPGPVDAFAWTDRGIYRPGETVRLMALLRDAAGRPVDLPARVAVKRPNGQVFLDTLPPRGPDASVHLPVALSPSAPAGVWTVELRADPAAPPIGRTTFRVDAFVPDRMAVDLAPAGPVVPGTPYDLPVTARYLYGAPAADLSGNATVRLTADPDPPAALAGYRIGLDGEEFTPDSQELTLPPTDAQGRTAVRVLIPRAPDTTRPVRAEVDVAVDDPSGRAVHARTSLPVRPAGKLIGIKPAFDGAVDAGAEAAFEIAAVDADGARAAVPARLRLVRERPDWRLVARGGLARYETTWRDEPLESADVTLPAGAPLRFARRLDFGRYRLEVVERGGLAAASVRFRAGWVASESPDVPDKVDVSADRRYYAPGEVARLRVVAPFAGPATLIVATDAVRQIRALDVPEGGTSVDVPVDPAWGPGAYAVLHVFRPGAGAGATAGAGGTVADARPARAIGLAWIGVDPAARRLDVAVAAPARAAPRGRVVVPMRTAPGAWVALAAVDEGILRLTNFATPDPAAHFLGRRTLGLDIRDDWGRLILPADGQATVLRQGGDDGGDALPEIPQRVVALFAPPVQAGPDGIAPVPLDLPDFNGQVRLMAVAWHADRVGSGAASMLVRDALVAEPLLPRFLAPGDEARLAVQLHNLDLPAGEAAAQVSVEGPLALDGPTRLAATLAPGGQAVLAAGLRATGAGRGVVRLDVTGPGGFRVQRESAILVRPARAPVALVSAGELAPGAEAPLRPATERLIESTWQAQAGFGGPVRYDPAALLRALDAFPLFCLEQTASKGLPLALFPDGPVAGEARAARLQAAVDGVLDKQRYDGGFGMWSASGEAQPWLSAYAAEFLLRARAAGAAVPAAAMAEALRFLAEGLEGGGEGPGAPAEQAYRLHVLALARQPRAGANRVLAERLDALPTPLAKAQLGAALARGNDRTRAEQVFAAALDAVLAAPGRRAWYGDYGTALRDQVAVALLLKESGLLADRLAPLLAALPGADLDPRLLSTQELAWTAAAAAVLGRDGRPVRVAVDGRALPPAPTVAVALSGPATARNLDDRPVWQRVSAVGVPKDPPPAARAGMRVTRRFYTPAGDTLDLDALRQNTSFVLLLEGRAEDGQDHYAMVLQGLPAGWEIAGRFGAGSVPGTAWLGELSEPEAQPASDDRFAAVLRLTGEAPSFRVAVRLRAVTPGAFELPGAQAADMYRPAVQARQATGRVRVLPAE